MRANTTGGQLSPQLSIWEDHDNVDNAYRNIDSTSPASSIGPNGEVIYTFEPPLTVTERQFVGFKFDYNGTHITGHTIAFVDVGEGNAPVSVHASVGQAEDFIPLDQDFPVISENNQYIPLISADFGEAYNYTCIII